VDVGTAKAANLSMPPPTGKRDCRIAGAPVVDDDQDLAGRKTALERK
jgi:hypothetical protein